MYKREASASETTFKWDLCLSLPSRVDKDCRFGIDSPNRLVVVGWVSNYSSRSALLATLGSWLRRGVVVRVSYTETICFSIEDSKYVYRNLLPSPQHIL